MPAPGLLRCGDRRTPDHGGAFTVHDIVSRTGRVAPAWTGPGFREFVALIAVTMGITALAIDVLLPGFPHVGRTFGIADANDLQLLVYVYMAGFGVAQLVYGPAADIVGRRPALLVGLAIYAAGCVLAVLAPSYAWLLAARALQGIGGAAGRVLSIAIVRDRFEGREMARIMSISMVVFLMVPILAPTLGEVLVWSGHWQVVFGVMLAMDLVLIVWFGRRMPETLHPEFRRPFSAASILSGVRLTAVNRIAMGYGTAIGLLFGCIMIYVGSAQQIFDAGIYHLGSLFPLMFGLVGLAMAAGTLTNSRLVRRLGMRRMSHAGLVGFVAVSLALAVSALVTGGRPPLALFVALLAASQFLTSIAFPNFNAMAMEPLGAVAGTASSVLGFYTTILGALAGLLVGRAFDGSVTPLALGFLVLGVAALASVLVAERGRLFRPQQAG
jgi:MFS transporter, DHA1 family, multidrug resistance protein